MIKWFLLQKKNTNRTLIHIEMGMFSKYIESTQT